MIWSFLTLQTYLIKTSSYFCSVLCFTCAC